MWIALLFEPLSVGMHFVQKHCTFSKRVSCKVIGPPRLVEKADLPAPHRLLIHSSLVSWVFSFASMIN